MAGVGIVAQTAPVALAAATKKTVLQIIAAAHHRAVIEEISISFNGISNTATPPLVEVIEQSDAGSGGDALTVVKVNPSDSETIQTTALKDIDDSTQPTDTAVKFSEYIHPQGGYTWQSPFGKEFIIPGGGRLGIAITSQAIVSCVVRAKGQE